MIKVGIYIRVSTAEQANEGYSIPAQKDRLISYCKARDFVIHDIYIDGGFSGANLDRPGMQKLIDDVKDGCINIVLVYKLDRLSRSQKDTLFLIEDVFLKHDVNFISMNESFDTTTPFGRAMVGILSVFAQLERETIRERTVLGKSERAKSGLYHGGSTSPIGYDYVDGKLIINNYEAMQIKQMFDLYLSGMGASSISKKFLSAGYKTKYGDTWRYDRAVSNGLRTILYAGYISHKGVTYPGQHEPIISQDVWDKTQKEMDRRGEENRKYYKSAYLLQGLIFCSVCGARYSGRTTKGHRYYRCYSRSKSVPHMIKDKNCLNTSYRSDVLESYVEDKLFELSFDKRQFEKLLKKKKPHNTLDRVVVLKKIDDLDKQIKKMMDLYQFDMIPAEEIGLRISALYDEKKKLKSSIPNETEIDHEVNPNVEEALRLLSNLKTIWPAASLEEKQVILRSLIKRIDITEAEPVISWSFL